MMQKTAKHRKKKQPEKQGRKRLLAGTFLAAIGAAGGIALSNIHADEPHSGKQPYHRHQIQSYVVEEYQDYTLIQGDRERETAWVAAWKAIPGDITWMDMRPVDGSKTQTFLDIPARDAQEYGIEAGKQYAVSMSIGYDVSDSKVVKVEAINVKDYIPLQEAARAAAVRAAGTDNLTPWNLDRVRLQASFTQSVSGKTRVFTVQCTNAPHYACTAGRAPSA